MKCDITCYSAPQLSKSYSTLYMRILLAFMSMYFENITDPMLCIQQWQEKNMSLEDAVLCIDKDMRSRNET